MFAHSHVNEFLVRFCINGNTISDSELVKSVVSSATIAISGSPGNHDLGIYAFFISFSWNYIAFIEFLRFVNFRSWSSFKSYNINYVCAMKLRSEDRAHQLLLDYSTSKTILLYSNPTEAKLNEKLYLSFTHPGCNKVPSL